MFISVSRNLFPLYPQYPNIVPLQNLIPFQGAAPATASTAVQTCICVPIGTCTGIGTVSNPTTPVDGSGIIDIRIVNNVNIYSFLFEEKLIFHWIEFLSQSIQPQGGGTTPTAPCFTGLQRCCYAGPYQCGVRFPPVAGSPSHGQGQADYGKYPWQAVLLGPGDVYQGSGVLIDPLNVLTTAHKVANYS